jgi:hypothetical protein
LAQENQSKDLAKSKSDHSKMHFLSNDLTTLDEENRDVFVDSLHGHPNTSHTVH